ncbi:hypothetical protein DICTH_0592 [Dictyoglomus thermophilum H-6-12]|uniref:Uncharacterized protein n=1 Tax=Dictyoglomus thermophilum (strain ATCC 35947 / DSM 3960 / H-6-12) TaxID=309799 RepID=B5YD66_DICT6|nr:hypothetical protein DICTH_0592 [Dictyoglomus thermophilum H-6-12]
MIPTSSTIITVLTISHLLKKEGEIYILPLLRFFIFYNLK